MLEQEIKTRIIQAMKEKDTVTRDVLRVTCGECERAYPEKRDDNAFIVTIKKILKGIETSLDNIGETRPEMQKQLLKEKDVLESFLPKAMTQEEIRKYITDKAIQVDAALGEGRCIGNVMKSLKADGLSVDSGVVKQAIYSIIKGDE